MAVAWPVLAHLLPGQSGRYCFFNEYELPPEYRAAKPLRLCLHGDEEDIHRGLNRAEHLRAIPPTDPTTVGNVHRTSGGFSGTASGHWDKCGSHLVLSQFSFNLKIERAAPDNTRDELIAKKLAATMKIYDPPQSGCLGSGATFEGAAF